MQQQSELPEGWVWTTLGEVAEKINPGFPSGKHNTNNQGVPHLRPMNINSKGQIDFSVVKYVQPDSYDPLLKGDVLFNNTNSPKLLGKTAYIKEDTTWAYSNHMTRIRLNTSLFNSAWISYSLNSLFLSGFFKMNCAHHVNQASINSTFFSEKVPIPLPPLAEQHRIVSAIEALFTRLDAANERLDRVPGVLKKFRQSVLAAACEGRLTEGWRKENPSLGSVKDFPKMESISSKKSIKSTKKEVPILNKNELHNIPEPWMWINFSKLICKIKRGPSKKCNQEGQGIRYITSGNIHGGKLRLDVDNKYLQDFADTDKCRLKPQDLILNCVNSFDKIGKTCVYPELEDEAIVGFNNYALELEIEIVLPEFINCFCQTNDFKSQLNLLVKHAVNQVSFAKAELDHIAVPLPPLPEQHEIVRRVDALFALADSIEAKVAAARERTEKLRQSILAKTFSGELVETEAELARREGRDYEPADVLLERIKAEQGKSAKKGKRLNDEM